jgi:hypothetical protein
MIPKSFLVALAALCFLPLSSVESDAMPVMRETGTTAPILQIWGGCGPYGHRGPFGGCRPGGQWGGGWGPRPYAWGGYGYAGGYGYRGGYWRGGYRRGWGGGYRRGWRR